MKYAKTIVLFVATLTMAGSAIAQTWTPTGAPVNNWVSVASSADGTRLAAGAGPVAVFTSTNSGVTWTSHSVADAYFFHSIVSSADGMKLMTLGANNSSPGMAVYTSTNAGVNWVSNNIPNRYLIAIASSADGNKLVAAVGVWPGVIPYLATNGPIFISTNSGVTWQQSAAPSEIWSCLASSADGTTLAAGTMTDKSQNFPLGAGPLYVSTNAGATWVPTVALTNTWSSIACSADGTKMIAAGRSIYTSTDSGVTWISNNLPSSAWASVASSADGSKLIAVSEFSLIYTSTNSGATWISNSIPNILWLSVASSADGNKLVAAANISFAGGTGESIYTSGYTPSPLLNITSPTGIVGLSWIVPSTNFVLQQSSDLATWIDVTNPPVLNLTNLQNEVKLSPPNSGGFYRLKTP